MPIPRELGETNSTKASVAQLRNKVSGVEGGLANCGAFVERQNDARDARAMDMTMICPRTCLLGVALTCFICI